MLENTRTTFTTALVRLIAWNMPFHAEHHAYPAVPFHKLPRFHEFVRQHLRTTERGYVQLQPQVRRRSCAERALQFTARSPCPSKHRLCAPHKTDYEATSSQRLPPFRSQP